MSITCEGVNPVDKSADESGGGGGGGVCSVCGVSSTQKCTGCWQAFYCSRQHQKQHWRKHKTTCRPFRIAVDDEFGRYVLATRKISRGEVVLKEDPLLVGPSQTTPPVCLGCHNLLEEDNLVNCELCGWPMCSAECAQNPHHVPECKWAQEKRKTKVKISQLGTPHPTYGCVMPIRYCYMKYNNPKVFTKLNSLECHRAQRMNTAKYQADKFGIQQLLRRFYYLTEEEFSDQELLDICGVIQVNGHEMPLSDPGQISIYHMGSMWEHSCLPNCSKSFSSSGAIIFRAAVDIQPGDHLSICYTDPMWPTPVRRRHLEETKFFSCRCSRCLDPTEMGTYFSAVRCLAAKDCNGMMLPTSFMEEKDSWECNECGGSVPTVQVVASVSEAAQLMSDKGSVDSCRRLLIDPTGGALTLGGGLLHPNNHLVVEVALALSQLYGQTTPLQSISDDWLEHKIDLCRKLIDLTEVLVRGECRLRGGLMFELHAAVAELGRRQAAIGLIDPSQLYDLLLESKTYLEGATNLLKFEPEVIPEGKMAIQAKENLKDLEKVLRSIQISSITIK